VHKPLSRQGLGAEEDELISSMRGIGERASNVSSLQVLPRQRKGVNELVSSEVSITNSPIACC
jgi:hypothetical protein